MRHFRFIFLIGFFCLLTTVAFAQKKTNSTKNPPKKPMFEGTIQQKPWSKSAQSYCAQGSEYFVLVQSNKEELVIQNESGQDLASFEGKSVKIEGKLETKTIKPSNNPMEQRPVSSNPFGTKEEEESFKCTILIVTKIK